MIQNRLNLNAVCFQAKSKRLIIFEKMKKKLIFFLRISLKIKKTKKDKLEEKRRGNYLEWLNSSC